MSFVQKLRSIFSSQTGVAHLLLIVIMLAGLILAVVLVQTRTNILPHAEQEVNLSPTTAFHLLLGTNYYVSPGDSTYKNQNVEPNKSWFMPGDEINVNVAVSSDLESANTFSAVINYPTDLLEVTKIIKENVPTNINLESTTAVTSATKSGSYQTCAQVITRACTTDNVMCVKAPCPPQTICKDFPTPCDVPEGWVVDLNQSGRPYPTPTPKVDCSLIADCAVPPAGCKALNDGSCCGKIVCENPTNTWIKNYFIELWLPDTGFNNQTGQITLSGGVKNPGVKTTPPNKPIMATIVFKAKKVGEARLDFTEDSLMLGNSNSTNILKDKNGITVYIKDQKLLTGDMDGDGVVGLKDFSKWLSKWGTTDLAGDLNGDGKINIFDFSILISNWKKQ